MSSAGVACVAAVCGGQPMEPEPELQPESEQQSQPQANPTPPQPQSQTPPPTDENVVFRSFNKLMDTLIALAQSLYDDIFDADSITDYSFVRASCSG